MERRGGEGMRVGGAGGGWVVRGGLAHTVTSDCSRQHAPSYYELSSTFHLKELELL